MCVQRVAGRPVNRFEKPGLRTHSPCLFLSLEFKKPTIGGAVVQQMAVLATSSSPALRLGKQASSRRIICLYIVLDDLIESLWGRQFSTS